MIFDNYQDLMGSDVEVIERLGRKGTKHDSYKIQHKEKYFVLKKFKSIEEAKTESNAYDIIRENTSLLLPRRYFTDKEFSLYEYIQEDSSCTPLELIRDWQKIHSNKYLMEFFEVEKPSEEHVNWLTEKVIERNDLYGENRKIYAGIIKKGKRELVDPLNLGVVHGDLRLDNVVCNKNSRFYLDLEFCGIKDPIIDLVPTVLYHLDWKDKVIELYSEITSFSIGEVKRRLAILSIFRGTKLIGFHNQRDIKEELKIKARKRIIKSLDSFLE